MIDHLADCPACCQELGCECSTAPLALPQRASASNVSARERRYAEEAAGRVIRKEWAALTRLAARCGSDQTLWECKVTEFYNGDHAGFVQETVLVDRAAATAHNQMQVTPLVANGPSLLDDAWRDTSIRALSMLALGESDDDE